LARPALILGKIPEILWNEKIVPSDEKQFRDVLHRYLRAFLTSYTPNVQIEGPICAFRVDGGIIDLKAALEFKSAATPEEVATAIGGLFEDTGGYAKSEYWTRF
jgi:hypothetical protein